eukprot:TRINITY_DN7467_c0_g1_i3.p4 TRINITY_DN7467_c0_g1~~TRINITY_DN7467_c0_g1_i3.p4  ORF type:complete len:105 (-),score=1.56 TRINITY_DN7467_c0_g1_i3:384-698(-)
MDTTKEIISLSKLFHVQMYRQEFLEYNCNTKRVGWGGQEWQQGNVCQRRTFVPRVMILQVLLYLRLEKKGCNLITQYKFGRSRCIKTKAIGTYDWQQFLVFVCA